MDNSVAGKLDRQPTLQTVTWFLNLRKFGQLDLNPPYQRKSVWTLREKQRFLDTVLRNYPSPAIFLHQSLDEDGNATYHVVDGKQRLSTILDFADGKIRLPKDFGDSRLDGKNWKNLSEFPAAKKTFWGYQLNVEFLDDVQDSLIREVFSRLNQNSRKLERQELRHARYDGWFVSYIEEETRREDWQALKVSTRARSKRMADVQLVSEFAQVILEEKPVGFDQDSLDAMYAYLDDPLQEDVAVEVDAFVEKMDRTRTRLLDLNSVDSLVTEIAGSRNNMYSLWCYLALTSSVPPASELAPMLKNFFNETETMRRLERENPQRDRSSDDMNVAHFVANSLGAATEQPQRLARHSALQAYVTKGSTPDGHSVELA